MTEDNNIDFGEDTQNRDLLNHLKKGLAITPEEARKLYGIGYLVCRRRDLKKKGYEIEDVWVQVSKAHGKTARVKKIFLKKYSHLYKPKEVKEPVTNEKGQYLLI